VTTAEQRAKLRSEARWLQSDGGLRVVLLDEIEVLSKALREALDGLADTDDWENPRWVELRKLVQS
jgi:hypothetical protein